MGWVTVPSQFVELASFPGAPTFDFEARRHDDDSVWNLSDLGKLQ